VVEMNPLMQLSDFSSFDTTGASAAAIMAMLAGMMILLIVVGIAMYIYMGLTLMSVAKKLKVEPAWLAWVPIGNVYLMTKMAKMPWWPMLLLIGALIPYLGIIAMVAFMVFAFIWMWKICEARSRPGWWVLLSLIPLVGGIWSIVMWGILAWGK
jgi:hypothetical protein